MHLHFDPVGGAAGDMFIAALLHAFPEHRDGLFAAIRTAGVPREIGLRLFVHNDGAMGGMRFDVMETPAETAATPAPSPYRLIPTHSAATAPLQAHPRAQAHTHGAAHEHHHCRHDHDHGGAHRTWADIRAQLQKSALKPTVLQHAVGIFTLIAEVEAKIHDQSVDSVAFHEVGAWDSIADIVGAAFLIDAIGAQSYSCSPLPLGSGRVQTAHGLLPVPAPATAALLTGLNTWDDGRAGERVTPTGAAILRYLKPSPSPGGSARRLARIGTGFGTKRFSGISNVLRVLCFDQVEHSALSQQVALIEFEVDDQTPEDLAAGLERLRVNAGVLDVTQAPVFGKKGRIAIHVQVLAEPGALAAVMQACFSETTTIGLRHQLVQRATLARSAESARVEGRDIPVKIVERPTGASAKAEMDALAGAGNQVERRRLGDSAVSIALKPEKS